MELEQVRAFLADHLGEEIRALDRLRGGEWSSAWGFVAGGRGLVARFGRHVGDYEKDRFAARWSGRDLPIPRVVAVGEAPGGYFAVSERCRGDYLDRLDAGGFGAVLPALFRALDAMRGADLGDTVGWGIWDGSGRGAHGTWQDVLTAMAGDAPGSRIGGWRERLAATAVGMGPFEEAQARLRALAPGLEVSRHLIHSDLLHFNVLVEDGGVTGVFDWGCGMFGDHLYDLAWLVFWQPWFPAWGTVEILGAARRHHEQIGLVVREMDARLEACMLHIGLDGQAYAAWAGREEDAVAIARRTVGLVGGGRDLG
ncbi:MAG: aminoglycoside phosphotransferase family protein [Chloroflexota bacterium]